MVGLILKPIKPKLSSSSSSSSSLFCRHSEVNVSFPPFSAPPTNRFSEKPNPADSFSEETMRRHSAIALRNLFTRNSSRNPQNLTITSSPVAINSSLVDVSGRIGSPSSSPYSKSSLTKASFSSLIFRIPIALSNFSHENQRRFGTDSSSGGSPPDVNKVVDEINLKFAEAREEIEMAMDAKETVYFNEEAECARAAVAEVLEMFDGLLEKVTEKEKSSLQRSMGLKMEQLKAELQQLNE